MHAIPPNGSLFRLCALLVVVFGLAACGGGGGGGEGDGGGSGSSSISYTGVASQAVVTSSNADDLSAGAVLNAGAGTSTSLVGAVTDETGSPATLRSVATSMAIKKALGRMNYTNDGNQIAGAMVSGSDTMFGNCGGSASYNVSVDDVTGNFNGSANFNGYCDDSDVLTGSMDFSGNLDINALINFDLVIFNSINLSTSSLTVITEGDTFTIAGSFSSTGITSNSESIFMTLNIRDAAGMVYRIENFQCMMTYDLQFTGPDRLRIVSGRFYHPAYGYVDIVTTSDFLITGNAEYPYSGVLLVTGNNGSRAELTANSDAQTFGVLVDADGMGGYDGPATFYRWDAL